MQTAEVPANEAQRLSTLYSYGVLDSEPEQVIDDVAELAAQICDAPIALVSLIDESRQWFKSHVGLNTTETARSSSFCAHAILQPDVFIIPDTLRDERFADNPLVVGPPKIRFYAGAPLIAQNGSGLGTLCVIDRVPRQLTTHQVNALTVLRTHVTKLLELRYISRGLDLANRELESFSYSVAHDLRAPLRSITGFSRILLDEHSTQLNEEARDFLQRINLAGQRMDRLTTDLLDLARLSRQPLQFRSVNLSLIIHDVMAELVKEAPTRQVDVTIQAGISVLGDEGLLRIVAENLLGNAWKFTSKRVNARIEFGSELVNGTNEYFVRDNGAGFDMAHANNLFQPFQRMHSNTEFPGTGIGLAIVKRVIQRHRGTIRAQSAIDQGTTIRFSLLQN